MLKDLFTFDYFKNAASLSILDIVVALLVSFSIGLFVYLIYVKTYKGVMHSSSFGISLIAMNLITTLVILTVSSNLIASLGMVGALSIVRFRTAVKEPLDLVYMFWSITVGIIVGVGLILLAVIGSLVIGLILFIFVNRKKNDTPYVVVISCEDDSVETNAVAVLKAQTKKYVVKAKTVSKTGVELTVEVRLLESSSRFVNDLMSVKGVKNATMVSYNGDYYM